MHIAVELARHHLPSKMMGIILWSHTIKNTLKNQIWGVITAHVPGRCAKKLLSRERRLVARLLFPMFQGIVMIVKSAYALVSLHYAHRTYLRAKPRSAHPRAPSGDGKYMFYISCGYVTSLLKTKVGILWSHPFNNTFKKQCPGAKKLKYRCDYLSYIYCATHAHCTHTPQ